MTTKKFLKTGVIIPAAGRGARMGTPGKKSKSYLPLLGSPVLVHTLKPFEASELVTDIVLVVAPSDIDYCRDEIVRRYSFKKVNFVVGGGSERQDSVANGLKALSDDYDIILVHDGARCLVTVKIIEDCINAAGELGSAVAAVPVKDTIKEINSEGTVEKTLDRHTLRAVQTPQAFRSEIIREAFSIAVEDGFLGTDSSSLVERFGGEVAIVPGSYENVKLTTADDLLLAEKILLSRGFKE